MPIDLTNFPTYRPYTNIQPFTVRDGATYLLQIEALIKWIRDYVIPLLNTEVAGLEAAWKEQTEFLIAEWTRLANELETQVNEALANQTQYVDSEIAEMVTYVNEQVALIIGNSIEVQDPVVAGMVNDAESQSRGAMDTLYSVDGPSSIAFKKNDAIWLNRNEYEKLVFSQAAAFHPEPAIWAYGHSFVAGVGLEPGDYYVDKVASATGMNLTNRGQGGTLAEAAAWRMWGGGAAFPAGHTAVVLLQLMMNSMRLHGIDTPTMRGVEWCWRTMVALASARALVPHNDPRITVIGTWASGTDATYPSGGYRNTNVAGAALEFTTTTEPKGTHILSLARKAGLAATQSEVRRMDTNEVIFAWDNTDQAAPEVTQNYAPAAIQLNVPKGTVIRFTHLSGTSAFAGLLEQDMPTNRPVIAVKEPLLADWSASTAFPNGSDAAANAFNAIVDSVASDYPNLIVVDPNPAWRKDNAASLVQADEVHPNLDGNVRLALQVSQLLSEWSAEQSAGIIDTGLVTDPGAVFTPAAGVAISSVVARKVGGIVVLQFTFTGNFANGMATSHALGTISEKYRPAGFYTGPVVAAATSSASDVNTNAVTTITTGGVMSFRHAIGVAATVVRMSLAFAAV